MAFWYILLTVVGVVLTLTLLWVAYMSRHFRVFHKMKIPGPIPWPALGSFPDQMREGTFRFQKRLYDEYENEKAFGIHDPGSPILVIRDLDMVRDISIKNFNSFCDRHTSTSEKPLKHMLSFLKGEDWRRVRHTVSPSFSSGKLKRMSLHVEQAAWSLVSNLRGACEEAKDVDLMEVIFCYAMDVIAGTGFGVQIDSHRDKDCQFANAARSFIQVNALKLLIAKLFPFMTSVMGQMGFGFCSKEATDYFSKFIDEAMANRRLDVHRHKRNDFVQMMIDSEQQTDAAAEAGEDDASSGRNQMEKGVLNYDEIQSQGIVFILGGYDTLGAALSHTLFLLSQHAECCQKVQGELDQVLQGRFPSYDSIQALPYLDMCLNEAIRLYPPGATLFRECTEDCVVQGIRIPKGMTTLFPVWSIHHDAKIWPEPEKFDPERFTPENMANRHPFAHIPYGHGPRHCIAMRLAQLEMKIAVAAILQEMTPVPCPKSVYPVNMDKFRIRPLDGLWVKMVPRNS